MLYVIVIKSIIESKVCPNEQDIDGLFQEIDKKLEDVNFWIDPNQSSTVIEWMNEARDLAKNQRVQVEG